MPPVVPIGFDAATVGASSFAFTTPAAAKVGDLMIAALAMVNTHPGLAANASSQNWREHGSAASAPIGAKLMILSRVVTEGDGEIVVPMQAGTLHMGAIGVYRGVDYGIEALWGGVEFITTSTNFVCPAIALATYSDLYIGIVSVASAATAVTPPAGTTERHEEQLSGRTLEIFDFHKESTGDTGTKTATTGAAQSGFAAAIAFASQGLRGSGKAFRITPPGAIGLPTEGV